MARTKTIANVRVGKPDVSPKLPSHVRGVREGNQRGAIGKMEGMRRSDGGLEVNARRSTGINPESCEPIDPRMPKLTPA